MAALNRQHNSGVQWLWMIGQVLLGFIIATFMWIALGFIIVLIGVATSIFF